MNRRPSRREALQRLTAVAGAGLLVRDGRIRGQSAPLVIGGRPVEIRIATAGPLTARITIAPITGPEVPDDGALDQRAVLTPVGSPQRTTDQARITAGRLTLTVGSTPPEIQVARAGTLVQRLTLDATAPTLTFDLPKGPLLGFGEGGPQFDRKGIADRMRSGQGGYRLQTHGGRVPIQWLIGADGWGLFIHRPLGQFDMTGARGVFTFPNDGLPLDLFLITGDPQTIIGEFASITGRAELPALWTFGYLQSHRTLSGPDDVMSVAKTLRDKKLPCDGLIYLGTDFTPSGWNTHNGEYTWNEKNFPDPKRMVDELHAQHFKVVLHTVIEGSTIRGAVTDPCTAPPIPPGRTPDGRWPPDRQVPCYWPSHKSLYDLGIDGWWPDQGDGYDAPSRLARIRMYWEGSQLWRPDERPFALHRNGYAGMQRYGAFLWSGDVYSRWETLATHVPNAINTSLSGIPFWGTDIGGFVPTADYTGELHVRWFQFGAFCPLFRAHGRDWKLRLPWGWNTGTIGVSEVANYTGGAMDPPDSELHNAEVEPICRKYLELRYRLLPYLYSTVRECTQTGLPIIRAMWLHYPDDPVASARGDQYLWGRDMLVAPVVEKGATNRRVYLPRGRWFDFWTSTAVDGGREIDRAVDLATMPLYVRAGTILPMAPVRQYVEETVTDPVTLTIYPGADGSFELYEDDGRSFAYRRGDWMGLSLAWNDAARRLTMSLARGSRMRAPMRRTFNVTIAGSATSRSVVFTGQTVSLTVS